MLIYFDYMRDYLLQKKKQFKVLFSFYFYFICFVGFVGNKLVRLYKKNDQMKILYIFILRSFLFNKNFILKYTLVKIDKNVNEKERVNK